MYINIPGRFELVTLTRTDAASLAALERDLIDLANGSRIKRARDRGILRTAAVMLHKLRGKLLDEADRAALCDRCMNPHTIKSQDELDDVCAKCPLEKTVG